MKIGELKEHCGNCSLIDYCTDPYETPELCMIEELRDMETAEYKRIAESITWEEVKEKQNQNETEDMEWDDDYKGSIVDIVLEKMCKGSSESVIL